MKLYLKYLNPIVSILILFICIWSAIAEKGEVEIAQAYQGGIPTYFLAKGLFCSSILFILGKLLEYKIDENKQKNT